MENITELHKTAVALLQQSKYKEAIEVLKKCKEESPFEPVFNYQLGYAYDKCNDTQNALTEYFAAIDNNYDGFEPIFRIGLAQGKRGNYKEALDLFDQALAISPENDEIFFHKALCYRHLGFFKRAITEYSKAISLNDRNDNYYQNRGNVFVLIKDFISAEKDFSEAITLNRFSISGYGARANLYAEQKEYEKAIADYSKVLEMNIQNLEALYGRGTAFAKLCKYDMAIADFELIPQFYSTEINCFSNIGICYLNKSDPDNAIFNFTKVIDKRSDDIEILVRRGMLFFLQKDYKKSYADLTKALKITEAKSYSLTKLDDVLYTIAIIELENDNFSEAIKNLDKCSFQTFLVSLAKQIIKFDKSIQMPLFKYFYEFYEIILGIKKIALTTKQSACHYSSLTVTDKIIISNENKLRFYNVAYMNDPEEGSVLLNILDKDLVDLFKIEKKEEEYNVYLGSFLPADAEDELVMWRTYGKEKGEEAKGCSITINYQFFDEALSTNAENNHQLYRVIYIDRNGKIIGKEAESYNKKIKDLNSHFITINNFISKEKLLTDDFRISLSKLLNLSLSEIIYLFKFADYSYENELRVIILAPVESKLVQIDNFQYPKKLYVESKKNIKEYIEKIVLGPKVENPSHWIYIKASLKKEGIEIDLKRSKCKFN